MAKKYSKPKKAAKKAAAKVVKKATATPSLPPISPLSEFSGQFLPNPGPGPSGTTSPNLLPSDSGPDPLSLPRVL